MNVDQLLKDLDINKDGKITEEDFALIVKDTGVGFLGQLAIKQAFRKFVDKNKDGTLNFDEAMETYKYLEKLVELGKKGIDNAHHTVHPNH